MFGEMARLGGFDPLTSAFDGVAVDARKFE